jgi:hypothetical protein
MQAIEFNDQIRKSSYSFEIHGDDIKLWPYQHLVLDHRLQRHFLKSLV